MKTLCREERPEKQTYSWEEGLSYLLDGEWAGAEFQREMTQDKVKLICQGSTPSKMGIFLRGRLHSLLEGELDVAESQRRMMQRMRKMTT